MSAKNYHEKIAAPLIQKLKGVIRSILLQFFEKTMELRRALDQANNQVRGLSDRLKTSETKNERLRKVEKDYNRLRQFLGGERADEIIREAKTQEIAGKKSFIKREHVR